MFKKITVFGWEVSSTGNIPLDHGMSGWKRLANTSIFTKWIQKLRMTGYGFRSMQITQVSKIVLLIPLTVFVMDWITSRKTYWRSNNNNWSRYYWHFIGVGCWGWREFRRNVQHWSWGCISIHNSHPCTTKTIPCQCKYKFSNHGHVGHSSTKEWWCQ